MFAETIETKTDYFTVLLFDECSIIKTSPMEDFDVYVIEKNGKEYVKIYVGNHPNFPIIRNVKDNDITDFTVSNVKILSAWKGNVLISKELFVQIKENDWPQYIHAFTVQNLSKEDILLADKIISSLKIR
jgi:hypothetical protein